MYELRAGGIFTRRAASWPPKQDRNVMELLITGMIRVALMVYASARIKKSAAMAYDEELIDTDEFSITKPEGFIIPTNGDGRFAFAAYSKEFGTDDADRI